MTGGICRPLQLKFHLHVFQGVRVFKNIFPWVFLFQDPAVPCPVHRNHVCWMKVRIIDSTLYNLITKIISVFQLILLLMILQLISVLSLSEFHLMCVLLIIFREIFLCLSAFIYTQRFKEIIFLPTSMVTNGTSCVYICSSHSSVSWAFPLLTFQLFSFNPQ